MAQALGERSPDCPSRPGAGQVGHTCSLLRSISERDEREWGPFVRPGDAVMDRRFLAAVERSMGDQAKFWNVVVRDGAGRPAAAAVLSLFPIDGLLFVQGPWKQWAQSLRRWLPYCWRWSFCCSNGSRAV